MSLFYDAENRLTDINETALLTLLRHRGVKANIYHPTTPDTESEDIQSRVYGVSALDTEVYHPDRDPDDTCTILIYNDSFVIFDSGDVSLLEGGIIMTDYDLLVGDILEIEREDNRERLMSIVDVSQIGTTKTLIKKYKFSSFTR